MEVRRFSNAPINRSSCKKSISFGTSINATQAAKMIEEMPKTNFVKKYYNTAVSYVGKKIKSLVNALNNFVTKKLFTFYNKKMRMSTFPKHMNDLTQMIKDSGGHVLSEVDLFHKPTGTYKKCLIVLDKVDKNRPRLSNLYYDKSGDFMNLILENRAKNTLNGKATVFERIMRGPKDDSFLTNGSTALRIVDEYGMTLGVNFVDVNKDYIRPKGLSAFDTTYKGVGTCLAETRTLMSVVNGSRKVHLASAHDAIGFHEKTGFVPDYSIPEKFIGQWMKVTEPYLQKMEEKHNATGLLTTLKETFNKLGLA